MGTYIQDDVERKCEICDRPIDKGQWMMDLFRQSVIRKVVWVHESCARSAIEVFLVKREERLKK